MVHGNAAKRTTIYGIKCSISKPTGIKKAPSFMREALTINMTGILFSHLVVDLVHDDTTVAFFVDTFTIPDE